MEADNEDLRISPFLNSLPKQDPFVVPTGFYERFPRQLQVHLAPNASFWERLAQRIAVPQVVLRTAMAAALVLLGAGGFWLLQSQQGTTDTIATTLAFPLEDSEWQDADLFVLLEQEPDLWSGVGSGVSTEELEAYLETEDMDIELLNELL